MAARRRLALSRPEDQFRFALPPALGGGSTPWQARGLDLLLDLDWRSRPAGAGADGSGDPGRCAQPGGPDGSCERAGSDASPAEAPPGPEGVFMPYIYLTLQLFYLVLGSYNIRWLKYFMNKTKGGKIKTETTNEKDTTSFYVYFFI